MATVGILLNGKEISVESRQTILEACKEAGIYVPSLCHYRGLTPLPQIMPDMACQLCLVEADGRVVLSCNTQAVSGMKVETLTPRVKELVKRNLREILRRYPSEKPADGELRKAMAYVGVRGPASTLAKKLPIREDNPFFIRDHNYCIMCQRCVRVCDDIRSAKAIEPAYPCHRSCPAGIDIPRYIRLIARGRHGAALSVIREKVPFPGVLGRVCIHPCEGTCQRGVEVDKPLSIRMLKRYAADSGDDSWKRLSKKSPPTGKKVAVVGSGPAGLTAAYYLAKLGHKVTVFEALPEAGGMMRVGIPAYRLPRNVLSGEVEDIKSAGVDIRLNTRVESLDSLFNEGYNAVFLGVGAHQGMQLGVDGENLPGIIEAAEYLRRANLGERIEVGDAVGVVGGGNVAIDAARMSLRLGARRVTIFYRRTRAEMPANPEEIEAAIEEGIEILYLAAPSAITRDGKVLKLNCQRMQLGDPDASGRRRPVPIEGSNFVTELDTLIAAIGQRPFVPESFGVKTGRGNVVAVSDSMMSNRQGVFAGGDCVKGPATVIEAIADARKAAQAIDRYLGGKGDIKESLVAREEADTWLQKDLPDERLAVFSHLSPEQRVRSFDEVERGMSRRVAEAEAQRCLKCYVITPPGEKVLEEANCQFCGACVDACPAGALIEKTAYKAGKPDRTVTTVCPYCGCGCQLKIDVKGDKIIRVSPDPDGPANKGQACVKGKFGLDFVTSPERLTKPLIRVGERGEAKFREASWGEALDLVSRMLSGIKSQSGPDSLAFVSSAKCTNEENYVAQKFARTVMGTNNVDHCARLCHASTVAGLAQSFGSGAMTNSIDEIGQASTIMVIGSNTPAAHPVIALQIKKAVSRGAKLIMVNPMEIALTRFADIWLRHLPGSDVALLMGMAKVIIEEGLADTQFINERCENFDAFRESLAAFTPELVTRTTGISMDDIRKAARLYATNKPASILYTMGITQHSHGTDNVLAVANLAMVTGNVGRLWSGVNALRGQNNVQGACDMGALPNVYSGYQSVADAAVAAKFEQAWGSRVGTKPGLTLTEMMDALNDGRLRAMWVMGENPVLSEADAEHARKALVKAEFLVVQDIFLTETARLADVVLPAASFAEKEGTFTSTERRVQKIRPVFDPPGEARTDWAIICDVANRMEVKGFAFESAAAIMKEIASVTPSYGGVSHERLEKASLQWPCPTPEHPGTPTLHLGKFSRGRARFAPLTYRAPAELPDKDYPFLLTTGRHLYHYHTGTMTRKVKGLNKIEPEARLDIHPADAGKLGIADGDLVRVASRRGEIAMKAKVSAATPPGIVFTTFHFAESPANALTIAALDPVCKIPEFKVAAVRIQKA